MTKTATKVTFAKSSGFQQTLNQKVNDYFLSNKIAKRDHPAMYFKTVIILGWVISAWSLVLFSPPIIWLKIIGCILLGMGIAGIGFSVGHDANHGGYSNHKSVNGTIGLIYDVIGLSSFLWRFRHNQLHHMYTNILHHDVEIHGDGLVRMTPYMEHKWYHRYQHLLINLIYAIIPLYWSFADIYIILFKRHYHDHRIPHINAKEIFILLTGKIIWLSIFLFIPMALGYSPTEALIGFLLVYMTYGILICNVFMLAHVLEPAEFIEPESESNLVDEEWAITQVKTTVDFAPRNGFLNWYLGGLNYQTIHHLYPHICHIHYPQIAPIVAEVCAEFGVTYNVYPTFVGALIANYRWLKDLGRGDNQVSPNKQGILVN